MNNIYIQISFLICHLYSAIDYIFVCIGKRQKLEIKYKDKLERKTEKIKKYTKLKI